jgi:hypothetical protein
MSVKGLFFVIDRGARAESEGTEQFSALLRNSAKKADNGASGHFSTFKEWKMALGRGMSCKVEY